MPMTWMRGASGLVLAAALGFAVPENRARAADLKADLGGDCCADLEERIFTLEASTVAKGNRKLSLEISGRIDLNVMAWRENATGPSGAAYDRTRGVAIGNNVPDNRDPEFQFSGAGKISGDLSAGFDMLIRWDVSNTGHSDENDLNPGGLPQQTANSASPSISARQEFVYVSSKHLGTLQLGYNQTAFDDAPYQDFGSGTVGGLGSNNSDNFVLRHADGTFTGFNYNAAMGEIYDD